MAEIIHIGTPALRTGRGQRRASVYPCLDENRRYRSFPCSECQAPACGMGKKPERRLKVELAPGQKACERCGTPYKAYGKSKYCSDTCRKQVIAHQRKRRRSRVNDAFIY